MHLIHQQRLTLDAPARACMGMPGAGRRARRCRAGFTLIELVVAIVALAALFAGLAAVFIQAPAASADPQIRAQARAIAEGYMEEILLKAYRNPEPGAAFDETGGVEREGGGKETRAEYDDVWDYCDIGGNDDCSQGSESPMNQDGSPMAGGALDDYTVEVRIAGDPTVTNPDPADITVIVSHRTGTVNYELVSQRADY